MKNKKILFISAFLILAFAGGIFFATGKVEEKWEVKEKGTNNLSANSENITTSETAFEYPYKGLTPEWMRRMGMSENYIASYPLVELDTGYKGSITFQQAANIAGELAKDIYGYTAPQKEPVIIGLGNVPNAGIEWPDDFDDVPQEDRHLEMTFEHLDLQNNTLVLEGMLEPYTGKVIWLGGYEAEKYNRFGESDYLKYKITQEEAFQMFGKEIDTLLQMFGYESKVSDVVLVNTEWSDDLENQVNDYVFRVYCEDGTRHEFHFYKEDGQLSEYYNVTELVAIGMMSISVEENIDEK